MDKIQFRKGLFALFLVFGLLISPGFVLGNGPIIGCLDIKDIDFGSDVIIESAELISGTSEIPEHCKVSGYRLPDDGFIIKLPTNWNGRLYQVGNGGAAGSVNESAMVLGLKNGFATAGGSGGHRTPLTMFQFGYHWWDDPNAFEKVEDYFYGSVHETNILARKMIKAYYGVDPNFSYYNGYSTGGRQALMEAQRFPEDFDGILGGSAPIPFTKRTMGDTWVSTQLLGDHYIPRSKLSILANAVMEKCDGIDGVEDGLIDDPRECDFNPFIDLPACPNDIDGDNCFTSKQIQTIHNIYDGVRDSKGNLLFKGVSYSSEAITANGSSGWNMFVPATPGGFTLALGLGSSFVQWIGLPPEDGGPDWDWKTFNVDIDWDIVVDHWADIGDTYEPDLLPFKQSGGKIIYYHGWADSLCWPHPAPEYYEEVIRKVGSFEATREFFKLYMIPGMTHLPGGRGVFDAGSIQEPLFMALVDWVENGIEPYAFIGTRNAIPGRWDTISRPICPYPEVARYSGSGDPNSAENFMCVPPVEVRIEPETLNLKSKGEFTVFITVPEGYDLRDWGISNVVCEGISAKKGIISKNGRTYIAKFKREDLKNIEPGETVTLTVKGIFQRNEKVAQFQGRDTIRVIK